MKKFLTYWVWALIILLAVDYYVAFSGSKTAFAYGWDGFFILCVVIGLVMIPALLIGLVLTYPHKSQSNLGEHLVTQDSSIAIKIILVISIVFVTLFLFRALFLK
jgi:hypothetical protein